MEKLFFLILLANAVLGTIVRSFYDEDGLLLDHHEGSFLTRSMDNGLYRVDYDMQLLGGNLITNLDDVEGINKVTCDLNDIEMIIDFNSIPEAYKLYQKIKDEGYDKFITSLKYNCTNSKSRPFVNIKQIMGVELNTNQMLIRTSLAGYEDLFKEGTIRVEPVKDEEGYSKFICFGVNANADCTQGRNPIPLYQNKYIDFTCSNCFVGAKATAFFDFKISKFKLRHVGAGLKDIGVNGAFVLEMTAQAGASGGLDKEFSIIASGLIMQFQVGPVPVVICYEIPLRFVANAMVDAHAHAKAGATASWKLGDAFMEWDEHSGWTTGKFSPSFSWDHVLEGDANFNAEASLSIIPSIVIRAIQIVEAGVTLAPSLIARAKGNTQDMELCADLLYKVEAAVFAGVKMNLPFLKIADIKYGPKKLLDTGEKPIGHWCIRKKLDEIA